MPIDAGSMVGRAILERCTIHVPDIRQLPEDEYPTARAIQRIGLVLLFGGLAISLFGWDRIGAALVICGAVVGTLARRARIKSAQPN